MKLNKISIFLYSFAIVLVEYLLLDLIISDITITQYRMTFTIGLLLTFFIIGFVTIVLMSDDVLKRVKEAVMGSTLNKVSTIIGIISTIILLNIFLSQVVFRLPILGVLLLIAGSAIVARILEKRQKKNNI